MQHPDLAKYERAKEILAGVIFGDLKITSVYTDLSVYPTDGPQAWELDVKVTRNISLTFHMEGANISGVREFIDTDGRRLVDPAHALAVLSGMPGPLLAALEQAVMSALSHALPK